MTANRSPTINKGSKIPTDSRAGKNIIKIVTTNIPMLETPALENPTNIAAITNMHHSKIDRSNIVNLSSLYVHNKKVVVNQISTKLIKIVRFEAVPINL